MDPHRALAEMALELEAQRSPEEALATICGYACRLVDADDAGILMIETRQQLATLESTTSRVHRAHQLQAEYDEGPCLDAIKGKATYLTNDALVDARWPLWGPAAAKIGIRSAVGVSLATRAKAYGSLNVYADRVNAFSTEDGQLVELLAAHGTAALAAVQREEQLVEGMESRTVIGQAQGILMQTFGIDSERAFSYLKRMSNDQNVRLARIAEAIVVQRDANARGTEPG